MYVDVMDENFDAALENFAVMTNSINTGQLEFEFIVEEMAPGEMVFVANNIRT